ncbi:MAG: bifunctional folylpolyglutamate synthase/dihydrofolate synthase [Holophagales bacterium]|nr:bifunctional folylpolyglutamate synthase/dihydrofolate synthase [Holophagales bacterium]MBK9965753.1 bifunctional folylpolyglutamate synthase/dihydrofolate synthase [Holophagales bacterium]
MRPGLARTRVLLAQLGTPQASFRTLLIGGTNGKGSTAAGAAAILQAAGLRVGLTTSPHLVRVNERVRLAGRDVSDAQLDSALSLVAAVSGEGALRPTYFEALVVAACELFRRARVEVGVVEVGIGGRLDATNVLDPEVSVVTNVEADHLETLGPTLTDVAREKAGIFRRGQPALTAAAGEALDVLCSEAGRIGARLIEVPPSPAWDDVSPLPGAHQRANLALAVAAARAFAPLDEAVVRRGIAAIRWPGRLQTVPRPGHRPLLVDGAHNPAGAAAVAAHLDAAGLSGRVDLVFGVLGDKAAEEMFAPLSARARRVVLVAPSSPRAIPPDALAGRLGRPEIPRAASLAEALAALEEAGGDAPILVAGSLVLAGEALALAESRVP